MNKIQLSRPICDHIDFTNSNGIVLKCDNLEMSVEFKAGYEDGVLQPMYAVLEYLLTQLNTQEDITINGLPCQLHLDGGLTCDIDKYIRGGLDADWCVPVWYVCGDSGNGIVIADTEDSCKYEVIAFERSEDADDKFITLHDGSVASCLQFVKSMSK